METPEAPKKFPLKRDEAIFRKAELSDENGNYQADYKLTLVLRKSADVNKNYQNNGFEGRLNLKFLYHGKSESEDLFLNFFGDVYSVIINGEKVPTHYNERRVYLDRNKLRKDTILNDVVILFSAKYERGGIGLHHFTDPIDKKEYLYTQFEPYECHLVFPVFDQPDIKSTLDLTLLGAEDWILLSNENEKWIRPFDVENENHLKGSEEGLNLTEEEKTFLFESIHGQRYNISHFETTPKISPYLYALCAGPYFVVKDKTNYKVPLRVFLRDSLKGCAEPDEFMRITIAGMEWYKNFFGIAYPFKKYDQIYVPEYNFGAMENVGLVTYNEAYCWKDTPSQQRRARFCITVLHELAHMWFGNLVTMKWWDDLWLNESFATFISFLCQSQAVGEEYPTAWISFNSSKGIAYREDQKTTTHPVMGDITDTDKAQSHFDGIVYYKGSSLLKQMFYFIGEENFSNGLKEYFKTYAYQNTTFGDFVDKMVDAINNNPKQHSNIPKFDLKALSQEWIMKAGLNQIELEWESDQDNKIKSFNIIQTACLKEHNNLQVHMIDVLFIYENENVVHSNILINSEEVTFLNSLIGQPSPKAVLLNHGDWGYLKFVVDKKSFDFLKDNLIQRVPDVLDRQLFYRSLFDMTRDAKISCTEYLDMIVKLLHHETNEDIISNTIRNISGLISNYLPIRTYPYYAGLMFDLVAELIAKNIDNKEIVINLVECIILFAYSEEHRHFLRQWITDAPYVTNKEVGEKILIPQNLFNQDNRFNIVAFIYRSRVIDIAEKEKLLAAEIERDKNSDKSVRATCRCKAALPDPQVKKELWNKFVHEQNSESLYNMKAYMSSFASIDQLDLVEDYLKNKFFEDVPEVGKNDHFYIEAWVAYCSPVHFVNQEIIEKLEKLAETVKNSNEIHRSILELTDDMRRFLKAQSLSEIYLSLLNKWA